MRSLLEDYSKEDIFSIVLMHAYISRGASRVESAKYAVLGARDLIK